MSKLTDELFLELEALLKSSNAARDLAQSRIRDIEAQLERYRAANVYDGNAHRRVSELETELAISKGREEGKQLVINQLESERDHLQRGFDAACKTVAAHEDRIKDLEAERDELALDTTKSDAEAYEKRICELEEALERYAQNQPWDRVAELEAALSEGAEYLHAFTPGGTPAVDAFIAKWSDRTAPKYGTCPDCGGMGGAHMVHCRHSPTQALETKDEST